MVSTYSIETTCVSHQSIDGLVESSKSAMPSFPVQELVKALSALNLNAEAAQNTPFINAELLLKHSAHVEGTFGAPGTIFFLSNTQAMVVNELGQISTQEIRRDQVIDEAYITKNLLNGMGNLIGNGPVGIPFLSDDQIEEAKSKLQPGTYLACAHTPRGEGSEAKRNLLFWINGQNEIQEACFHFEPQTQQWANGGPRAEHVPTYPTLAALINAKVPSGAQPLRLIG
ncbi:MAG: hypothetical protein NT065_01900 [Chlamydiae bacterium]|nr:hypothetical protein [Chlamydiota bacterium]